MAISSSPTNAYGLYQYIAQRIPGYDPSEYLREINAAYIHVWEEVAKLKNHYFTYVSTLSVTTAGNTFDLLYNTAGTGTLSSALDKRLYQITRIRVQPPAGGLFQTTSALTPNDPDYLSISANPSSTPTQTGPYYWWLLGRGSIQFGLPLATGSQIEFTYTYWPLSLTYLTNGTVSSIGQVVTGTSTTFTQLAPPDFQSVLPGLAQQIAEIVTPTNQVYQVTAITNDTSLQTLTAIAPTLSGSNYVLASVPEVPREHIRVIGSVAMAKMFSVDGDDARVAEWTGIAASNMQMMKDSLIERQSNNPPKKQRFP